MDTDLIPKGPTRGHPEDGMVLLVPVSDAVFAYIWSINFTKGWLLDFVTDYPTRDPKYFTHDRQKYLLGLKGFWPRWLRDVVLMEREGKEKLPPYRVVHVQSDEDQRRWGASTRFVLLSPMFQKSSITEEEAAKYPREYEVDLEDELIPFVRSVLPELERIQVPKEDRWKPRPSKAKIDDSMPLVVEVHFQADAEARMGLEADEIADELDGDLQEEGLGGMLTVDSAGAESEFEVVLEVSPRRVKSALRQIRRTLRRLKAPDSTFITFMGPDGPERHPLVEPKGG